MSYPNTINLNNKLYYSADELHKYDMAFFAGVYKNIRNIIKNKNLSIDNYKYAYINKKGEWIESKESYARAKLLLESDWVENNVPKVIVAKKQENKIEGKLVIKKQKNNTIIMKETKLEETKLEEININDLYDIVPAPEVLELEDNEKFKDMNGKVLNIMVRGERHHMKCYFNVKDISKEFEMNKLYDTLIDKRIIDGYQEDEHYKYFSVEISAPGGKIVSKKELYLTYEGMIRLLYVSKSPNAKYFRTWATEKLFTIQMGSSEQKEVMVSDILGVSIKAIKEVFNKNIATIPSIYLFSLNTVKNLRTSFNISEQYTDDMIVCKYGCTKDIEQRTKEHQAKYGKIKGVNLGLMMFSYIDPQYIFEAETSVASFLNSYQYKYEQYNELVIINPKQMKQIKQQFDMVQNAYAGHCKELIIKIKELENYYKVIEEKHKNELQQEKHKNELIIEKHKNELQLEQHKIIEEKHKNEILQMKLIIAEMKNK
jgi:hypothetical protein